MYTKTLPGKTSIKARSVTEGERIEQKLNRIINNKEPIHDTAPLIYTERKDGVNAQYNIRTDRWELAADAMDAVSKSNLAKREFGMGERTFDTMSDDKQKEHIKKFPNSKHKKPETGANTSDK